MTAWLAALLVALAPAAAGGAALVLTEGQKGEALRAGERSVTSEAFGAEWRVANGAGEVVTVLTPFHRLALAARHAAFRGKPLEPREPDRLLREQAGRLVLWAELRGAREDFARHYQPRLWLGSREIRPAFVQNEHTAVRQPDGRYLARCLYAFPTGDLTPTARVTLVVTDADGRDASRFVIDLGAMR